MDSKTPLVIKNVHRTEALCTPVDSRIEMPLRTALVCRLVRRDFHLLSAKMLVFAHKAGYRAAVQRDLDQFETEIGLLEERCHALWPTPTDIIYSRVPLRLVSAEGARLYRLLRRFDDAYGCLYVARFESRIDYEQQIAVLPPVLAAYLAVKSSVMRRPLKSVQELMADLGIA